MPAIGWGRAAWVWAYALAWFVIIDQAKHTVDGRLRRRHAVAGLGT